MTATEDKTEKGKVTVFTAKKIITVDPGRPEAYQAALAKNPMGRMADPQDVANAAVFLSSPRASFVSGINMIVDGAMTDRVNY